MTVPADPAIDADRTGRGLGRVQGQIWASQRRHPTAPLANMAYRITIDGPIDPARFISAFATVVDTIDVLRSVVTDAAGATTLRPLDRPPRPTELLDLDEELVPRWCAARLSEPIDATACVYDSVLIRHRPDRWTWWLDLHHVVTDAAASKLVFEATAAAYAGEVIERTSWAEHLAEQIAREEQDAWVEQAASWRERVPSPAPLALHGAASAPTTAVDQLAVTDEALGDRLSDALARDYRSLGNELSLLAVLATATAELVHRLDGRDEIVLGVPVHHRSDRRARSVIGPLVEIFPLVVQVADGDTHRALHRRVTKSIMRLLRDAAPGSSPDQAFSAVVNVHAVRYGHFAGLPTEAHWVRPGHAEPTHLLQVQAFDHDGRGPSVELDVNHAVGDAGQRARLAGRFAMILDRIVSDPDDEVGAAPLLVGDEAIELAAWERPAPLPTPILPLAERVRSGLRRRGDAVAIGQGDRRLSGRELDELVGRTAAWFVERGLGPGDRVGIRVRRSIEAVALVHGALRAGVSFVPLDPDHPATRHAAISTDAGLATVLDDLPPDLPSRAIMPVDVAPGAEAYLLYTSGSTGEPKGVPISRAGLDDYLTVAENAYVDDDRPPTVALHSSLVFDLTITSLFLPLVAAGLLVVVEGAGPAALAEVAADDRIDLLKATPSQLELLVRMGDRFPYRHVVVGGEAFRRHLAARLVDRCEPGVSVWNEYGPTEAVVGCMIHRFDPELDTGADVPIGAPMPGCDVRVLDRYGHRSPPGSWGELWVHRPGMATGYLHRPEQTALRFVGLGRDEPHYRTGDRARVERPGVTVYGGRDDDQLKVGGIRLEPGEVEAALATHPEVTSAVVRTWRAGDDPTELLTAWYRSATALDAAELRRHLRSLVAEHAVPAAFVHVHDLPLAASAKVDVERLPPPTDDDRAVRAHRPPATDTERELGLIWSEVLGLDRVGLDDDFFDVGGDSLAALEMLAVAAERFRVALDDAEAFERRTLGELAATIDAADHVDRDSDATGDRLDGAPTTSSAQQALLVELRDDPLTTRYCLTRRYRVEGALEPGELRAAARRVVGVHPNLRWTLGSPRRELAVDEALEWREVEAAVDLDSLADEQARQRFEPTTGPLLRMTAVVDEDGSCREVLVSAHHLWFDAGSFVALWRQIDDALGGGDPTGAPVAGPGPGEEQLEAAARSIDEDARPALWATDRPVPPESDGYLRRPVDLGSRPTRPVSAFLAAVAVVLGAEHDTVVGVPMSTRTVDTVRDAIGFHLNTVPVRLAEPRADRSAADLLDEQDRLLDEAWHRRQVPYADLIARRRRAGHSVDLARVLVVHDPADGALDVGGARLRGDTVFHGTAVADLSLFVTERADGVDVAAEWSGRAHRRADVEALLDRIGEVLHDIVERPDRTPGLTSARPSELVGTAAPDLVPVTTAIWAHRERDTVAVRHDGTTLTYRELVDRAERIAGALARRGVGRGDLVGLVVERRTDLVAAILGIQRLGAGYVPIDPGYPDARIETILAATALADVLRGADLDALLAAEPVDDLGPMPTLDDPAYVIHTSGSTGTPKGVMVRHRHLAASNGARVVHYDADPGRFLLTSSVGFDSSVVGLFWTLTTGGELVLPDGPAGLEVTEVARQLVDDEVTHVLTVPSLWSSILRRLDVPCALRTVVVAGETCPADVVTDHVARLGDVELWNEYGPTEATVWATVHRCAVDEDPVPIGRPIPGTAVRVADVHLRPVPPGTHGELLIGGLGVTDGYLTDTTATATRFVERDGRRWYRTGDRAVLLGDGTIGFLGRIDEQLSLGGVRVEPAEIERVLERQPMISAALVRTEPRSGDVAAALAALDVADQRSALIAAADADHPAEALVRELGRIAGTGEMLVAHVEAETLDESQLRDVLLEHLPRTLVPHRIVRHDVLPRTSHGKLDRDAVPLLALADDRDRTTVDDVADADVAAMVELWREVLGDPGIGPRSAFLAVGGDSLTALELVDTIAERLGTELPVARLMEDTTPTGLARIVGAATTTTPHVVTMRRGPADRVLVILPPAGGLLFTSQPLADALDQTTVVGLQYPGADGREAPERSIDALAARLAPELNAAVPEGPIRLLGASTGGLVAVELARQLVARGRTVDLVAMVDTYTPQQRLGMWRARRDKYLRLIRRDGITSVPTELARKLRDRRRLASGRAHRPTSTSATAAELPRMLDIARRAELAHRMAPTDLPVVLYAATGTNPRRTVRGWQKICSDLTVVELDGTHTGTHWIMGPDRVDALAADLGLRLSALSEQSPSER